MEPRICPYCQEREIAGQRVQCGAPDCARLHNNARARAFNARYKEQTGTHYAYSMPSRPRRKSNTHCVDCGTSVRWGTTQETRCRECSRGRYHKTRREISAQNAVNRAAAKAIFNSRLNRARRKLAAAAEGVPANPRWRIAEGPCRRCGARFTCRVTNDIPAYCSIQCNRLDGKDRRRAMERGVRITPARRWAVYERDGWICQLCMRPINRVVRSPHPMSASIDHIVPLFHGGAHSEENWQCAHFICNSRKSHNVNEDATAVRLTG
jgi:5-methylcytosine-specific restriction endonuclease McrA